MSDLADLLEDPDFRTGSYLVTRRAAPTIADGIAVPGTASTFATGSASLQPAEPADLKLAPEGSHLATIKRLWTTATLRTVPVPDIVTIDGEAWRVFGHADHAAMGGRHQVALLAKQVTT